MKIKQVLANLLALSALGGLGACSKPSAPAGDVPQPAVRTAPATPQASLCEVDRWEHDVVAQRCKPGQKLAYLPASWGNDQLPILFAAVNCDLQYQVVLTKGAVTCIYQPVVFEKKAEPPARPGQDAEKSS